MSKSTGDPVLEECGLTTWDVAVSAGRVFNGILGLPVPEGATEQDTEDLFASWEAVTRYASAMFRDSEEAEIAIAWVQFADMLRKSYSRAEGQDIEIVWEQLPVLLRFAWEYTARHLANILNLEAAEARRIGSHEARIVEIALSRVPKTP